MGCNIQAFMISDSLIKGKTIKNIWGNPQFCTSQKHPQYHACHDDFVIMARIKEPIQPNTDTNTLYKIDTKKIYKDAKSIAIFRYLSIHQSLTMGNCKNFKLITGRKYLLTGQISGSKYKNDDVIKIDNHSWIRSWQNVTVRQRKGFHKSYHNYCQCKMKFCKFSFIDRCSKEPPLSSKNNSLYLKKMELLQNSVLVDNTYHNLCRFGSLRPKLLKDCQNKWTFCQQIGQDAYEWNRNEYYINCLNRESQSKFNNFT
ncbi:unnamed protein product [Gordionus sp. m RMFG-2023]